MYGNPLSKLAKALSSKYPTPPVPEAEAGAFSIPKGDLIYDETEESYTLDIPGYTPKDGDLILIKVTTQLQITPDLGDPGLPVAFNGALCVLAPENMEMFATLHPLGDYTYILVICHVTPEQLGAILLFSVTAWSFQNAIDSIVRASVFDPIAEQVGIHSSAIGALQTAQNLQPTLYFGTSETPPAGWQTGDIYIQHEE